MELFIYLSMLVKLCLFSCKQFIFIDGAFYYEDGHTFFEGYKGFKDGKEH